MDVSIGSVFIGLFLSVLLGLSLVNLFRPDLFRFEAVSQTGRQSVRRELEQRIASLKDRDIRELWVLSEETIDRRQIDGRDAFFLTARQGTAKEDVKIVCLRCSQGKD